MNSDSVNVYVTPTTPGIVSSAPAQPYPFVVTGTSTVGYSGKVEYSRKVSGVINETYVVSAPKR